MEQQPKRHRGAQEGNKNALKHGYYSKIFTKEEKSDYCQAGDVQGIDEEIALIRHVIKTVAQARDEKSLSILVRATNALNRLLRTRARLEPFDRARFKLTLEKAVRDVAASTGVACIPASSGPHILDNQLTNQSGK